MADYGKAALGQIGDLSNNISTQSKKTGYVYNADIGLRKWRAALAKIKAGANLVANVSFVGDSITEGGYAGAGASMGTADKFYTNGYFGRVRSVLISKFGDAGRGFIPTYYPNNAPEWTFTADWSNLVNTYGVTGFGKATSTNGGVATFNFSGTGVGIMFARKGSAGSVDISIDGDAPRRVVLSYGAEVPNYVYEVTGLTDGNHVLTITAVHTAGQQTYLSGAYSIKGNKGIRMHMCGKWGSISTAHVTENALKAEIDTFSPILTVIAIGANDYTAGTPLETYRSNVQTLISRAKQFGDVLVISNGIRTEAGAFPQVNYANILKELSLQNDVAYIDFFNRWGGDANYAKNTLGFFSDTVHPNDYGHQDLATGVLNVILESSHLL